MKNWYIKITAYVPYPKPEEFRIGASSMGTAISRAIKQYRSRLVRKKITQLDVQIRKI